MSNSIPSEIDHLFPSGSDSLIEVPLIKVSKVIDKLNCDFDDILDIVGVGSDALELITLVDFELIEKPFPLPQKAAYEDCAAPLVIPCIHTTRFRLHGRIDVSEFLVSSNSGKTACLIALQMDIKATGGDPDCVKTEKPITITSENIDQLYIHRNQLSSIQHLHSPKQQPDVSSQLSEIKEKVEAIVPLADKGSRFTGNKRGLCPFTRYMFKIHSANIGKVDRLSAKELWKLIPLSKVKSRGDGLWSEPIPDQETNVVVSEKVSDDPDNLLIYWGDPKPKEKPITLKQFRYRFTIVRELFEENS